MSQANNIFQLISCRVREETKESKTTKTSRSCILKDWHKWATRLAQQWLKPPSPLTRVNWSDLPEHIGTIPTPVLKRPWKNAWPWQKEACKSSQKSWKKGEQ